MTTAKDTALELFINGKQIKQVDTFVYLGHKLSAKNDGAVAVKHRIGLGWAAFEKNKSMLTSRRIPYHIKSKIYNTYVLHVVLYGLECVNWTEKLHASVETFQNHMMRFITNHKLIDHIKIEDLYEMTKLTPIMNNIRSKCIKLYGHIKRSNTGLSKLCLEGMIEGKRNRGRPAKRWLDNIHAWTQLSTDELNNKSTNRDLWKELSHVNAQSSAGGDSDDAETAMMMKETVAHIQPNGKF